MAITNKDIDKLKEAFATKEDLKRFATKEDLKRFATKDDLKRFATKDDLKRFATKDDLKRFATKEDMDRFETKEEAVRRHSEVMTTLDKLMKEKETAQEDRIFAKAKDNEQDQRLDGSEARLGKLEAVGR